MQKAVINRVVGGEYSTIVIANGTSVVVETCWFPDSGLSKVVGKSVQDIREIAIQHIAVHRAEMGVN